MILFFYVGAGTSGRLEVLDSAECPPTFGTDPELIQAVIAGGLDAMLRAVENVEDDRFAAAAALHNRKLTAKDVLLGITASGRTPFVQAALDYAREVGAAAYVYLKTKNPRLKKNIAGALPVGIIGVGEPLLFGVSLPPENSQKPG